MEIKHKRVPNSFTNSQNIFVTPTSTVASENAFSLGRRVVNPFRVSLTPKIMEALVCTSGWLRAGEVNFYKDQRKICFNFTRKWKKRKQERYALIFLVNLLLNGFQL